MGLLLLCAAGVSCGARALVAVARAGACLDHDHLGLGAVAETAGLDLLLLEVLVDLEEVLDLVAELGRDVVHVVNAHPGGVAERHAEDLLVRALRVGHVEHADDARADPAAGERRLADEAERVQRVAVLAERALDEPVVGGVAHRGEQAPVEDDVPGLRVELVLVPRAARHLDEIVTSARSINSTSRPEPPDPLDEQVEEPRRVELDADVDVLRPVGAQPEVDDRPAAAELGPELHLDVAEPRRDEAGTDQVGDGDRVVDRRAVPAVRLAVVDGEELDEVGDEVPIRPVAASRRWTSGPVTAWWVTSSPIIVTSTSAAKTTAAASGSAQTLNSAAGVMFPSAIAPPITTICAIPSVPCRSR